MKLIKRIAVVAVGVVMVAQMLTPATNAIAAEIQDAQKYRYSLFSLGDSSVADASSDEQNDSSDDKGDSEKKDVTDGSSEGAANSGFDNNEGGTSDSGVDSSADESSTDGPNEDSSLTLDDEVRAASEPVARDGQWIDDVSALRAIYGDGNVDDSGNITSLKDISSDQMILLSHVRPEHYENTDIKLNGTGTFSLAGSISATSSYGATYSGWAFQGLGGTGHPYAAMFDAGNRIIELKRALFASYKAQNNASFKLQFKGAESDQNSSLFADAIEGNSAAISVEVIFANGGTGTSPVYGCISAPLVGKLTGSLSVDIVYQKSATGEDFAGKAELSSDTNNGLVARVLDEGSSLEIKSFTGLTPSSVSVASANGNAGLLVGTVGKNATLKTCGFGKKNETGDFNATSFKGSVSAANNSAGGLVGEAGENSSITIADSAIDLSGLSVAGKTSGGFVGTATKIALNDDSFTGKLKLPNAVGNGSTLNSGGFIGTASFNGDYSLPTSSDKLAFSSEVSLKATGNAGGLFGQLSLLHDVTVSKRTDIVSKKLSPTGSSNYGGLIGKLVTSDGVHKLTLNDGLSVTSTGGKDVANHYGGLVGLTGSTNAGDSRTALIVRNVGVNCSSPSANRGFGGVTGCLDRKGTIDLGDFSIGTSSSDPIEAPWGNSTSGGVAGEIWPGGIIQFSGTTDLSVAHYRDAARVGQLVGNHTGGLLYALGNGQSASGTSGDKSWTLKRGNAVPIDDVASYGEVIRLGDKLSSDLIKLDNVTYDCVFKETLTSTSAEISTADQFALYAIAWQSFGAFKTIEGVSSNGDTTWNPSTDITFAKDSKIDLTGTGLTGLSRDVSSFSISGGSKSTGTFKCTVNGDGATVTLAIGEPYGMRGDEKITSDDATEGNGRIYRHDRLGLFASITSNVANLTVSGSMKFTAKNKVRAGALASTLDGSENSACTLSHVTSNAKVSVKSDGGYNAYVGGYFGVVDTGVKKLTFASSTNNAVDADMTVEDSGHAERVLAGGAIGSVEGASTIAIAIEGSSLTVSGSMMAKSVGAPTDNIPFGGFIGVIYGGGATKTASLSGLSFSNFKMTYPKCASAGGLLGYMWAKTDVVFKTNGLNVTNSSFGTSGAGNISYAGGLVYRASGKWAVTDGGIDLSGYTVNNVNDTLGLLVCRGGANKGRLADGNPSTEGLYLEVTSDWGSACVLNKSICGSSPSHYDEWVASTVDTASPTNEKTNNVLKAGVNGVVSLHTASGTVTMGGTDCNTYQNRTAYGQQSKKTNVNTRYYYNLDKVREDIKSASSTNSDTKIDTPQELMLWSVIRYADSTLAGYLELTGTDCADASCSTITGMLDLKGYSYYPVDVTGTDLSIKDVTIKFYNKEIEAAEERASNKSATGPTQHMGMHAGLIRNFAEGGANTLSIKTVKFAGSIGMMANGDGNGGYTENASSGVLVCGDAYGSVDSGNKRICTIDVNGLTLEGIAVNNFNVDYAPLLISGMGSAGAGYVSLSVNNVRANYDDAVKDKGVATSLLGNLGSANATQIAATFNDIAIPSSASEKIFIKASFLHSFAYDTSAQGVGSATYTFYKQEATNNTVTYGQEIDRANTEYSEKQLWYFDDDGYKDDKGLVTLDGTNKASVTSPIFGNYLPYVYMAKNLNGGGDSNHEIKVNQRLENLTKGCGTYTDPYVISKESTLTALAAYIEAKDSATDGWSITIARDQSVPCARKTVSGQKIDTSNEVTYVYSEGDGKWHTDSHQGSETLSNDTMHRYIQSCYLDFNVSGSDPALELHTSKFNGLGSADNAFRGVLTSTNGTALKIDHDSGTFSGLIKYGYGCVVKNLNIEYTGSQNTVAYSSKDAVNVIPGSFFGGVFGAVLGGDNIIDAVNITAEGFSVSAEGSDTSGANAKLVPLGGYVGVVAGGGVLFRGKTNASWYSGSDNYYDNPVVGRVLDGYVFNEDKECKIGDNGTDGNYPIVSLDMSKTGSSASITTDTLHFSRSEDTSTHTATTTNVSDAQGLLILSAIINSGAAAGSMNRTSGNYVEWAGSLNGTNAYMGKVESEDGGYSFGNGGYGKVRNASYDNIGVGSSTDDFELSVKDDMNAPGITSGSSPHEFTDAEWADVNAPYLVSKYCANKKTMYICGAGYSTTDLRLTGNSDYDLSGYGNAFLGLSGRYYTNALKDSVCTESRTFSRDRAIPWIVHIDGGNKTVRVNLDVKEYPDEDFSVVGVGGLFSYALFTEYHADNTVLASNGNYIENLTVSGSIKHTGGKGDSSRGVGAIAGVVTSDNNMTTNAIRLSSVKVENVELSGPATVGGFFGNTGLYKRVYQSGTTAESSYSTPVTTENTVRQTANVALKFSDCSYNNLTLVGSSYSGGYVGLINASVSGKDNVVTVSGDGSKNVGSKSKINTKSSSAGGLFGRVNAPVHAGDAEAGRMVLSGISATSEITGGSDGCGGLVGCANGDMTVEKVSVNGEGGEGEIGTPEKLRGNSYRFAGGLVGNLNSRKLSVSDVKVNNVKLTSSEGDGGVVGTMKSGKVIGNDVTVSTVDIKGSCSGGFVGSCDGGSASLANSKFISNTFNSSSASALWNSKAGNVSGGISGDARGEFKLSNILISGCKFNDSTHQGILSGNADPTNLKKFYLAGLEVRKAPDSASDTPSQLFHTEAADKDKAVNQKAFVTFSNYNSEAAKSGKTLLGDADEVDPYVTTSPVSDTTVSDGDKSAYLFGDGANLFVAKKILSEKDESSSTSFMYQNVGGLSSDGSFSSETKFKDSYISTYGNNNTVSSSFKDFPVLQLAGGDGGIIESYLDVVTNGGFSEAVSLNPSSASTGAGTSADSSPVVTATAYVYKLVDGTFVKQSGDGKIKVKSNTDGTKKLAFDVSPTQYDNGENTFTLVTVTFKAAEGMTHKVMVPVIVRRQLETTFVATLNRGTKFTESAYIGHDRTRQLESYGSPTTALLTYTYNKGFDDSKTGSQSYEYGWDTYLAAGGSMGPVNKTLKFVSANGVQMPVGTQLTLVDKDNQDVAYTYTIQDATGEVALSQFKNTETEEPYSPKWMSELMGVSAGEGNADTGEWFCLDSSDSDSVGKATAKAKASDGSWKYYRPYVAEKDKGKPRYTLTCEKQDGAELTPSESFYLVIYIPRADTMSAVNGSIQTDISCDGVKFGAYSYMLRSGGEDPHSDTASAYNFHTGYDQDLSDESKDGIVGTGREPKIPDDAEGKAGKILHMDMADRISFDSNQLYKTGDPLYYGLTAGLGGYELKNGTVEPAASTGFPKGVSGTATFYVYTQDNAGNKTYYVPGSTNQNGVLQWTPSATRSAASAQDWTSSGSDMQLSFDEDLDYVREAAKNTGYVFYVETTMDIHLSMDAFNTCIAASKDGSAAYTCINYRAMLSDAEDSLASSSTVKSKTGDVKYYRKESGGATIALNADKTYQLGINLNDLTKRSDGRIDATGVIDLSGLSNVNDVLAGAKEVDYVLTLEQKQESGEYLQVNIGDFLDSASADGFNGGGSLAKGQDSVTWTDSASGGFVTNPTNSNAFEIRLHFKVNTAMDAHEYANYRLRLSAVVKEADGTEVLPVNKNTSSENTSANSDYVTYTLTKVELEDSVE